MYSEKLACRASCSCTTPARRLCLQLSSVRSGQWVSKLSRLTFPRARSAALWLYVSAHEQAQHPRIAGVAVLSCVHKHLGAGRLQGAVQNELVEAALSAHTPL